MAGASSMYLRRDDAAGCMVVFAVDIGRDVPPGFRSVLNWSFPIMIPAMGEGEFHEEVEVLGGADHLHPAPGRCVNAGCGSVPQGRYLGRDVLQLAQALWRDDAVGGQAHAPARGREQSTQKAGCRSVARPGHAAGCPGKKARSHVSPRTGGGLTLTLLAAAGLSMRFAKTGRCRSVGLVPVFGSIPRSITTSRSAATRLP